MRPALTSVLSAVLLGGLCTSAPGGDPPEEDVLYASMTGYGQGLAVLDRADGSGRYVGDFTGVGDWATAYGVAFDADGSLLATYWGGWGLAEVDPATGALTDLTGGEGIFPWCYSAIDVSPAGDLYGISYGGELRRIDRTTLETTLILTHGPLTYATDMSFDSSGLLWVIGYWTEVHTVDLATNTVTYRGRTDQPLAGIAFDSRDVLYGVEPYADDARLFTVDTSTLRTTVVGYTGLSNGWAIDIFVRTNEAPSIAGPASAVVECASPAGTEVALSAVVDDPDGDALDVAWTVDGVAVKSETAVAAGSTVDLVLAFGPGSHSVVATVSDGTADPVSAAATVVVRDTTAPAIALAAAPSLRPADHGYAAFDLSDLVAGVSDSVDGALDPDAAGAILSVSSDEPEDAKGGGDGSTLDDIVLLGASSFKVRAERAGGGNGRVYTVTFTVADASGNAATASCTIGVPHDQGGRGAPVDDGAAAGYTVSR